MVSQTWQPIGLNVSGAVETAFSAQKSDDGKLVVVRYVNTASVPQNVSVSLLKGGERVSPLARAQLVTLASDDPNAANSPGQPLTVSPKTTAIDPGRSFEVPPNSYSVLQLQIGSI